MKKIISLVLVISLVLGSFSFAFAFEDVDGEDCEESVETLVALGVIDGYKDGTFRPEKTVTRAQIAKMLIVALGYEKLITANTSSFNDTTGHWAEAYISFAAGQGIVKGYTDGSFKPDATVSYDEAITMILRALGYTDDALTGTWPTSYKIKALDLDITDGVSISSGGADRGGVAMLIYNALQCNLVYINADDEITYVKNNDGDNIALLDRLGDKEVIVVTPNTIDEDSNDYVESNIDLEPYMFETLEVNTVDDVVVYITDTLTATLEGDVDDIRYSKIYVEEEDGDKEHFSYTSLDTNDLYFNGAVAKTTSFSDLEDEVYGGAKVKVVFEKNSKDKIVTTSPVGIVAWLETETVQIDDEYDYDDLDIDGIDLPVTLDDDDDKVVDYDNLVVEGDENSLGDIEEEDIVTVYTSDDKDKYPQAVKLVVTRDTVEGKLTKVKDKDTVVVDGITLDVACDATDYLNKVKSNDVLGNEGTFYLDENREIFEFEGTNTVLTNYAMVIGAEDGVIKEKFGDQSVDTPAQIKLAKSDGETIVYDLYYDIDDKEGCTIDGVELLRISGINNDVLEINKELKDKLVLFDTNNSDEVDELQLPEIDDNDSFEISGSRLGNKYRFTRDTIIFDAIDDYKIVDLDDLAESITASVVKDENSSFGNLEVVIVHEGSNPESDGTYALILDVDDVLHGDDEVQELTVLVDGEEKTLYTDKDDFIDNYDYSYKLVLSELTLNSDEEVIEHKWVAREQFKELVEAIDEDDSLIRVDGTNYLISDEIVVYVADYDRKDDEWTVEAGDLGDIDKDDYATLYDLDVSEDDGLEVMIIYTGDIEDYKLSVASQAVKEAEDSKDEDDIDDAQVLINDLENGREKDELQERLDDVKDAIDAAAALETATAAVVKAEGTKDQNDVDDAQDLIEDLENGDEKDALQARLDLVIAEIAVVKAEESKLQADINAAQKLVTDLVASDEKDALQKRIDDIITANLADADAKAEEDLTKYEAEIDKTYNAENFAKDEKENAETAIEAYKALAEEADKTKYDARKTAADNLNTLNQNVYDAIAVYEARVALAYDSDNFASTQKTDAETAITTYKDSALVTDKTKYDILKTGLDDLNTLNQNVYDALAAYEAKINEAYNKVDFAATQKLDAENAIVAYKAPDAVTDKTKYDIKKSELDTLNTLNQNVYDALAAYEVRVALNYDSLDFALIQKTDAETKITAYKDSVLVTDKTKYDAQKTTIDVLNTAKQELFDAKAAAEALNEADYTDVSWTTFLGEKATALAMLETTVDEMNAKTVAINNAIDKLDPKTP